MTGKLLAHFVLFLSSLVCLAAGDDGFVLDLVVVPFEGQGQEIAIKTDHLNLEVNKGQIGWNLEGEKGVCAGTTIPQPHGGEGSLSLPQLTAENWKIRVRTTPGSYLVFDSPPKKLLLSFEFGDKTGEGPTEGTVDIEKSPLGRFEIKEQLAKWSDGDAGNTNLLVTLRLVAPDNDCTILDDDLHGFVFSVNEPLYDGSYSFSPCNSYIRFEDGSHTVTSKRSATRRLEWNEENPGRFLEEGSCPYCINGGTCPCCPDPNDGNSTAEEIPQDDNEVAEPPGTDEEQPSRRAFIIGYTVGGVAIAAVLILSLLMIYNVMKADKSSEAVPNTGDDDNAAANDGGDDVES